MSNPLADAVMKDDIDLLKAAIQQSTRFDLEDALYYACKNGKFKSAKYLIEEQSISPHLNIDNPRDNGPVFKFAAESGNLALVKYLVENHQVNIESLGQYPGTQDTALGHAAYRGHKEIVKYLLMCHANPNAKTSFSTILTEGILSKDDDVVEALLVGGAKVTPADLHRAIEKGLLSILKLLVKYGGDLTKQYIETYTITAASSGNVELLKYLEDEHHLSIADTFSFKTWEDVKHEILRAAAESGNVAMMRYLVEIHHLDIQGYVTNENTKNHVYEYNAYNTILGRAVSKNIEMVQYLFEELKLVPPPQALKMLSKEAQNAGSRMNAYLASHLSESKEDKQFLKIIYETEIPQLDTATLFKMHHSELVKKGHYENFSSEVHHEIESRKLTDEQIIQAAAESKEAAIHMLTYYCSYQFADDFSKLKLLLDQGYDINTRDHNGNTLAHLAARSGAFNNIVKFLLEKGADIDLPNNKGETLINIFGTQLGNSPYHLMKQPFTHYTNSLKRACSCYCDHSLIPILTESKGEIGSASPQELVELAIANHNLIDLLSHVNDAIFEKMKVIILSSDFLSRHELNEANIKQLITEILPRTKNKSTEERELLTESYNTLGGYAKVTQLLFNSANSDHANTGSALNSPRSKRVI